MNSGSIQKTIIYIPEEGEHHDSIDFEVILQHRELIGKEKADEKGKIIFDYTDLKSEEINGFSLDISDYNCNNLFVIVKAKYLIKKYRFIAWRMSQPTRNITMNLQFPADLKIEREFFIHDHSSINETINNECGMYSFTLNGWLMPEEGATFQIMDK